MQPALIVAIGLLAFALPAAAADMPVKAPVRAPAAVTGPVFSWTGVYVGGHVGGGWGDKCFSFVDVIPPTDYGCHDVDGWLGGGQVGFNWQVANIVLGVEFSGSAAGIDGTHTIPVESPDTLQTKMSSIFLLTGRLGVTWDRVLAYVVGGGAWFRDKYRYVDAPGGNIFEARETRSGWTIGGGVEFAFTPNWSIAAQYNFVELGDRHNALTHPTIGSFTVNVDQHLHLATVRLNYRFGVAAPVTARY